MLFCTCQPNTLTGQQAGETAALCPLEATSVDQGPFPSNLHTVRDPELATGRRANLPPVASELVSENQDIQALNQLDGFSMRPRMTIPFTGGKLAPDSINGRNIFVVKIDDPGAGTIIPGDQFIYDDTRNRIICAPRVYLRESSRYGLVVTRRVMAEGGTVARSKALDHLLATYAGGTRPDGGYEAELGALFAVLEDKGILKAGQVLSAAVFATRTVTDLLPKLRGHLEGELGPLPDINFDVDGDGQAEVFRMSTVDAIISYLHRATVISDGAESVSFPAYSVSTFFTDQDTKGRIFIQNQRNRLMVEVPSKQVTRAGGIRGMAISTIEPRKNDPLLLLAERIDFWRGRRRGSTPQLVGVASIVFGNCQTPSYVVRDRSPGDTGNKIPRVKTGPSFVPPRTGTERIQCVVTLPEETPQRQRPTGGWPLVHYAHGGGSRALDADFLAVAETLAHHGLAAVAFSDIGNGGGPETFVRISGQFGTKEFKRRGRAADLRGEGIYRSNSGANIIQRACDLMTLVRLVRRSFDCDGDGVRELTAAVEHTSILGASYGGLAANLALAADPHIAAGAAVVAGSPRSLGYYPQITSARTRHAMKLRLRTPSLANGEAPVWKGGFNEDIPLPGKPVQIGLAAGAEGIQKALDREHWLTLEEISIPYLAHVRRGSIPGVKPKKYMMQFARGDDRCLNVRSVQQMVHAELQDVTTIVRLDNEPAFDKAFGKFAHAARHVYFGIPDYQRYFGMSYVPGRIGELAREQVAVFLASGGRKLIDPDADETVFAGNVFEVPVQQSTVEVLWGDPGYRSIQQTTPW